ncbi:unnamed protein product [Hymenolepis diminuta]|uniref:Uncharacterized protein n=1 Tax=Hymenolepis diminuta TaxID=6216 RepID=A0A564Z9L8_HYMDI|nr:unnamed protein product [Hymenolepis diminuta]
MSLLGCPRIAQVSATSKVKALLVWRNVSRDDLARTARTTASGDMVSLSGIQDTSNLFSDLFAEDIDIPAVWRRCLVEGQKTEKNQPITSSLMPPSSTEANGYSSEYCGFRFNSGVLVIGGTGRNKLPLRSTELLTQWWGEGGGGGSANWQWRPFPPMNDSLPAIPLSVYFQGRVYIVGRRECVDKMEMEMERWQQARLYAESMASVGNELFMLTKEINTLHICFIHCRYRFANLFDKTGRRPESATYSSSFWSCPLVPQFGHPSTYNSPIVGPTKWSNSGS